MLDPCSHLWVRAVATVPMQLIGLAVTLTVSLVIAPLAGEAQKCARVSVGRPIA